VYEWILTIIVGLIDGMANVVVFGGGFRRPRTVEGEEGETIYDPGFAGAMFVSGVAGYLAWAYSSDAAFSDTDPSVKPIAGALVAGIAGSRVLAILVERQFGAGATARTEVAAEDLTDALANTRRELEAVRESEQSLRQENQDLRNRVGNDGNTTE
jgi:hypothetical protein